MNVSSCMRTKLLLTDPARRYKELLCMIARQEQRQIYVVDKEYHLLGIITSFDLIKEIVPSYMTADLARSLTDSADFIQKQVEKVRDICARDLMVTDYISLHLHSQLLEADALVAQEGCHAFPVVDEHGRLLGELTRLDVLIRFADYCLKPDLIVPELFDLSTVKL
ncbi:HPP family protein [Desulfopila sp. IMCC35008]|uniref:CBS domain-containing protein n=1 Tax=Desulfopila sp. IMCC35008 TaxID=2653858 RepID=UPI0013D1D05F|nr:CBS domain-containing protein [Desulfopila sp. IMCC35008]